jgi:hypothetical protein
VRYERPKRRAMDCRGGDRKARWHVADAAIPANAALAWKSDSRQRFIQFGAAIDAPRFLGFPAPSNSVEDWGIEPQTLGLQSRCSPAELIPRVHVGSAAGGGASSAAATAAWQAARRTGRCRRWWPRRARCRRDLPGGAEVERRRVAGAGTAVVGTWHGRRTRPGPRPGT